MTEASPLRGRRDRRGAGHERGRGGHATSARSSRRIRAAGARCGCAARRPRRSCSGSPPSAPTSGRSASPRGWPRWPTAAPSLQLRRATAGADLVHAHGLRAGLVAAAARRLSGERQPPAGPDPAQRPAGERRAPSSGCCGRSRGRRSAAPTSCSPSPATSPTTPAGSAPATSGSSRRSPRRCRRPTRTRAEVREELGLDDGRPLVRRRRPAAPAEGLRRPARRRRPVGARRPAAARAAGRDRRRRAAGGRAGRAHPGRAAAGPAAGPAVRRRRPARRRRRCACCPRAGRAARSPRRRRCAPGRRWSPPAPAASPSCWAPAPSWCRSGDAAALADAVVRVLDRPGARRGAGRGRPRAGRELARRGGRRRGGWSPSTASCSARRRTTAA